MESQRSAGNRRVPPLRHGEDGASRNSEGEAEGVTDLRVVSHFDSPFVARVEVASTAVEARKWAGDAPLIARPRTLGRYAQGERRNQTEALPTRARPTRSARSRTSLVGMRSLKSTTSPRKRDSCLRVRSSKP